MKERSGNMPIAVNWNYLQPKAIDLLRFSSYNIGCPKLHAF